MNFTQEIPENFSGIFLRKIPKKFSGFEHRFNDFFGIKFPGIFHTEIFWEVLKNISLEIHEKFSELGHQFFRIFGKLKTRHSFKIF